MAKKTTIVVTHRNEQLQTIKDLLLKPATKPKRECVNVARFFDAISIGARDASFTVQCDTGDAVAASGTITLSSLAAADTITVGTEVFTASASPSGNNQFLVTGGDTAAAAAAAVKIAAHPNLANYVTASAASGVITVAATVAGRIGNNIPIAISAHGSVSGSGKLTSGADPTTIAGPNTYHNGV